MGDKDPQPSAIIDDDTVASALEVLGEYAAGKDVMVLIETNGAYADTKRLSSLIQRLSCSNVGVLWDIHHPYRYFKESPKQTYDNIGRFIRYVHVKDSVYNENGSLQYKMMGYGDLPVKECIRILNQNGYDGYLSLEWVKRWYSDLEAPGVVFLQYINYMKKII